MPTPSRLPIRERNPSLANRLARFRVPVSIKAAPPSTTDLVSEYTVIAVAYFVVIAHFDLPPFLVADLTLSCGWVTRGESAVEG